MQMNAMSVHLFLGELREWGEAAASELANALGVYGGMYPHFFRMHPHLYPLLPGWVGLSWTSLH